MNQKEKARELYWKYYNQTEHHLLTGIAHRLAIACAIIAVDAILNLPVFWVDEELQKDKPEENSIELTEEFWNEVKNELNKML